MAVFFLPPSTFSLVSNAACTMSELELGGSVAELSSGSMGKACSVAAAHIAESVRDMGLCPDDLSPAIAAAEIHVHTDYRGTPRTAVPLNEERIIALPAQGARNAPERSI